MPEICDKHSNEIVEIRTEFNQFKKNTDSKFDEILEFFKVLTLIS